MSVFPETYIMDRHSVIIIGQHHSFVLSGKEDIEEEEEVFLGENFDWFVEEEESCMIII